MPMLSIDSETSGLDLFHGAALFFITTANDQGEQVFWEVVVDPLTRKPQWMPGDIAEIEAYQNQHDEWVLHNSKFDMRAEDVIGVKRPSGYWNRVQDTLLAAHLLASNQPHDLTTCALVMLGINIKPYEDALERAVKEARNLARRKYPDWLIAKDGLAGMPSAKATVWKYDSFLPRTIALHEGYEAGHPWYTVLSDYGNADSAVTLPLFKAQKEEMLRRGLWEIYECRRKLLRVVYEMEGHGVTLHRGRLEELRADYAEEAARAERVCLHLSQGTLSKLPKSGSSNALKDTLFKELGLPVVAVSKKTREPSVDKTVLDSWLATLPPKSRGYRFVHNLRAYRKRCTALSYMESYERFWLPLVNGNGHAKNYPWVPVDVDPLTGVGWYRLHPSLNITGTDTLRFSSQNPNEQNISKQEGFNLRYLFGPAPGREWWSLDYDNVELRIPAYESGEQIMINIFEKPDDPPYYGSYHLMNASIIYPDLFWPLAEQKGAFKKKYASTWYQWVKNFGFALAYGAMETSGTADRAAHKPGAQRMVMDRLKQHTKLNQKWISFAEKHGYVETMPDKEVCPARGYPLLCSRTKYGGVLPTVPLNFHVQGTACWVMMRAMVKVHEYLSSLKDCYLIMNIHDEMVIDLPAVTNKGNLPIVQNVRRLMGSIGDCIGVPLTCGMTYHTDNWSTGETL